MVKVELAVYDLSRGMAASMSQQLLGQRIDAIYHTGIVVYGNEYYFGGGIQVSQFGSFSASQGLYPIQMLDMGETTQSKIALEQYISSINHRFTAMTYDLLTNNCNNFSDTICRFLTNRGIPSYIVDLPSIVLSTPGGQAFRPLIEQMQNSVRMQHGAALPFGSGTSYGNNTSASFGNNSNNTTNTTNTINVTTSNSTLITPIPKAILEDRPLVSSDSATVITLTPKLLAVASDDEKVIINNIVEALTSTPINYNKLNQLEFDTLLDIMKRHKQVEMTCLFLFRLMVIPSQNSVKSVAIINNILVKLGEDAFSSVSSLVMAICTLANYMSHEDGINYICKQSKSLTLTSSSVNGTSSVSLGHEMIESSTSTTSSEPLIDKLVDVSLKMTTHARCEVRQMSFALLYNIILIHTQSSIKSDNEEIPQHLVEILCNCIQTAEESDKLVCKRKLSIILRCIRRFGKTAAVLLIDLEYDNVVKDMLLKMNNTDDTKTIVSEIQYHLDTHTR